jgi:hypothetical protein
VNGKISVAHPQLAGRNAMALTPQEKKRKEKELKRRLKLQEREPLALSGDRFRKPKYVPAWMAIETAIYEAFVISDKRLTDQDVFAALGSLVRQLRTGPLPSVPDTTALDYEVAEPAGLVVENIRRSWELRLSPENRLPREELIGVLRSIADSLQVRTTPFARSQGYLNYLEGYLGKVGVSVRKVAGPLPPDLLE